MDSLSDAELTTRLEIIEDIRTLWEQCNGEDEEDKAFDFSYIQVSTLLLMPLNALQGLRGQILSIVKVLEPQDIQDMLSLCTKRARSKGASETSESSVKSSYRNAREQEKV